MAHDPEDPRGDRPRPDGAFDAIVDAWRRDGDVPAWPEDGTPPPEAAHRPYQPAPEDDRFVPPDPPPLPRLGPPAAVGLGLLALGLVLVGAPGWIGVSPVYGLPLGLLTLAAGLGWLVLRLWPTPPEDEDDDGARL